MRDRCGQGATCAACRESFVERKHEPRRGQLQRLPVSAARRPVHAGEQCPDWIVLQRRQCAVRRTIGHWGDDGQELSPRRFRSRGSVVKTELACRYAWERRAGLYPGVPHPLSDGESVQPARAGILIPTTLMLDQKTRRVPIVDLQVATSSVCESSSHSSIKRASSSRWPCSS
jgi:hypothetical protein